MKLFVVAISVDNEYAGRVLDVSWVLARTVTEAEKLVKAHAKRTFKQGGDWGTWDDLEIAVEEVPSSLDDQRGDNYEIKIALAHTSTSDHHPANKGKQHPSVLGGLD